MTAKKNLTVYLDAELSNLAHEMGLNISKTCENALKMEINRLKNSNVLEIGKIDSEMQLKGFDVARERFELSSGGPKPSMLDHYTTGLHVFLFDARL